MAKVCGTQLHNHECATTGADDATVLCSGELRRLQEEAEAALKEARKEAQAKIQAAKEATQAEQGKKLAEAKEVRIGSDSGLRIVNRESGSLMHHMPPCAG